MSTYQAFLVGVAAGAATTTIFWLLTNLRSWAERRNKHALEPLPDPPKLSDHIRSVTTERRNDHLDPR